MRSVTIRERGPKRKRLRGPRGGNNKLRRTKAYLLYEAWLAGMTARKAARFVGVANNTAMTYFADFNEVLGHRLCLCGDYVGHRGWCRKLFLESPRRQEFLRKLWRP